MTEVNKKTSLHDKYCKGPYGLGDPNDKSLRKVELQVMIPKKMREIANREKCVEQVEKFTECCKNSNILMTFKCQNENKALRKCLEEWYHNEEFKEKCKNEYLQERSEYRATGITQKQKERLQTSM